MTSSVRAEAVHDQTELVLIVRRAIGVGVAEAVLVLVFSLATRLLAGPAEVIVQSLIVAGGLAVVMLLPGLATRARTIEGIAGAAGIGLGAAVVYLILDVVLLQPIGTYSHRWLDVGGGSNWWYHPVWWMVGTFIPMMGAWAMAHREERTGDPSAGMVFGLAVVLALLLGALAIAIDFPGAGVGLPTFAVAFLPALPLTVLITGRGGASR